MKELTAITIDPDGKSALFQGGSYAHDVMATLWDQGYVTGEGFLFPFPLLMTFRVM